MQPVNWQTVPTERIADGVERQVIWGEKSTLARFRFGKGTHVARHDHASEQVTCVIEGALRMQLEGRDLQIGSGEVLVIPPDVEHEVWFLEDSVVIDFFAPPRDDWKAGQSHYLAGQATPPRKEGT